MARTKTNTRDDTKTLTAFMTQQTFRKNVFLCFSDFSYFIFFFIDNFLIIIKGILKLSAVTKGTKTHITASVFYDQ